MLFMVKKSLCFQPNLLINDETNHNPTFIFKFDRPEVNNKHENSLISLMKWIADIEKIFFVAN